MYIQVDFKVQIISTKNQKIAEIDFNIEIYAPDKSNKSALIITNNIIDILSLSSQGLTYITETKVNLKQDAVTHQVIIYLKALEFKQNNF